MNLTAEHVSVLRGRTEIVHDVSFSVSDGQWLMICGPNGAGKSTLLSAVSQELPYTGLVTLDGTDLRRMKPRPLARRMAMLRQLSDLAYAYTVEEIVAMDTRTGGCCRRTTAARKRWSARSTPCNCRTSAVKIS